jgi:transposase
MSESGTSTGKKRDWEKLAIELDTQGWTLTPIARRFGVPRSTVYGVLVRARGKGIKHRGKKVPKPTT